MQYSPAGQWFAARIVSLGLKIDFCDEDSLLLAAAIANDKRAITNVGNPGGVDPGDPGHDACLDVGCLLTSVETAAAPRSRHRCSWNSSERTIDDGSGACDIKSPVDPAMRQLDGSRRESVAAKVGGLPHEVRVPRVCHQRCSYWSALERAAHVAFRVCTHQ